MMEFSGKTYEEAVNKALEKLNVSKDELIIEKISDKPNSILDILKEKQTGQVYIRVKLKNQVQQKESHSEEIPEYVQKSLQILKDIANYMQAMVNIKINFVSGDYILEIEGEDKGLLIGKHGNTLNSLQNYINFIINKNVPKDQRNYVIIDSDNYRERRKKQLIDLALKTAKLVQQKKEPITLPPMLAFERKIIHIALKDNQYVTTYSVGENPYKSVVIAPLLDSSEAMFS
ncbi:MAG: RNA-binding cell elongation regulator Jag/EloR [Candidatus Calescibacterium sp.]|nr:KH domain-containing protein [Candidatus Calescibacterium sp.]MCX7972092.1 KH domain-containing protein [bacterium]MDW8194623.1 RNA-binding cell elongation regulator Jag/EloR [Candidatus Calescibacterium sp.]